jgi:hypothetical protein
VRQDLLGRYNAAVDLFGGDGRHVGEFVWFLCVFIAVYRHGEVDFRSAVSNLVISIVFCPSGSMPEAGVVMEGGEPLKLIENVYLDPRS